MPFTGAAQQGREAGCGKNSDFAGRLLGWYDRHRRRLPWRAEPGEAPTPYHVWLSEIMLQQTTVVTVGPYFRDFIARWPTVAALAAADRDDVLARWAGLGYYARARNLHAAARIVAADHGGRFPRDVAALQELPGIGPYTAAAIAAIAFDAPVAAVDGNVERVLARHRALETPPARAKAEFRRIAQSLVPDKRAGDFAQAMMDLGATVCTPRGPNCRSCPVAEDCRAYAEGAPESYPRKEKKAERPTRYGTAYWLEADGKVLLRRRPDNGLLGGMLEVPSSPWTEGADGGADGFPLAGELAGDEWRATDGGVSHVFTHFRLELQVMTARLSACQDIADGIWAPIGELDELALPSVMRKIVRHALASFDAD